MTTTPTATKVLCPECRRENELERVYCHDCGARLDRKIVRSKKEPMEDTHRRVKRMFDPQRAKMKALFVAAAKLIFSAGLVAMIIDMALPPDVPPPAKEPVLVSSVRFDLENMVTKRLPPQKEFSEDQVNAFIASALNPKRSSLDQPFLPFKRALVVLHEGSCAITTERSLNGFWSIYTTCSYAPALKGGHLSGKILGGRIGRLPVHPSIARYMGVLFGDVSAILDRDLKLISRMGAMELHQKSVTLRAPSAP